MEITTGTPNWLKIVIRNSYVRATFITLLLTAILIMLFVSIGGPVQLLGGTAFLLGAFLAFVFFVMSIFSVSKQLRKAQILQKSNVTSGVNTTPSPQPQPDSAAHYKRRLIWSLIVAVPGALIWLLALTTTQNGGGEAFIVFTPLFLISSLALLAALFYCIAYIYKKIKETQ
nr:hypothetical protein [Nitrosomonas nitrosa]